MNSVTTTQAVILVGGLGTRLGALTATTPKPLLDIGGRPFLDYLVEEVARHGCRSILFLAQFESEQINQFCRDSNIIQRFGIDTKVSVEPYPAGTGGALWHARHLLDDRFFLLNGDSWLDMNLLNLTKVPMEEEWLCNMVLRRVTDAGRFGSVSLAGNIVTEFAEKSASAGAGLINGGIYLVKRAIVDRCQPDCSLERDVFPSLVDNKQLYGLEADGYFIDIGVADSLAEAQASLPARFRRPAIFFDRDGVLNIDHGYVGKIENFEWMPGAIDAIRFLNDNGYLVFVVTNQAGVARGYYSEADVDILHRHMQGELARHGAHIDDFRYCPFHVDGIVEQYAKADSWRKPEPGMILDILDNWTVDLSRSKLIGDKPSDIEAGRAAGLSSHLLLPGSDILQTVMSLQ